MNRAQLKTLSSETFKSGQSNTLASEVRSYEDELIDSCLNVTEDADQNGGYLAIDENGRVDVSKINSADTQSSKQVLNGNGTWRNSATGRATLNGTGAQTTFNVTHNLGFTPNRIMATPGSADAAKVFYTNNYTATTFDVVYLVAPTAGSGNVIINFLAE